MTKKYYVYILSTEDKTLYCGYTDDVYKRFEAHKNGKGAKYTKAHKPVEIVYQKAFNTKSEAMKEEYRIKKLSRDEKLKLISEQTSPKTHRQFRNILSLHNLIIFIFLSILLLGILTFIKSGIRGLSGLFI